MEFRTFWRRRVSVHIIVYNIHQDPPSRTFAPHPAQPPVATFGAVLTYASPTWQTTTTTATAVAVAQPPPNQVQITVTTFFEVSKYAWSTARTTSPATTSAGSPPTPRQLLATLSSPTYGTTAGPLSTSRTTSTTAPPVRSPLDRTLHPSPTSYRPLARLATPNELHDRHPVGSPSDRTQHADATTWDALGCL
ncbi:hypothetical protein M407DRAFT_35035 [Tulasnella calospora MUT 4182]|uniref:Uncharacterized protein n=1 Tax=Tulasnella calospora MUT 4182 TaxID=1051891 RepID=A0A0C3K1W8_9AGAM|nr:hypothetical protein M407DRAFT_35035 [Tulasnella calospora MUT 4182]